MTNEQLATIEERINRPPDAFVHDWGMWQDYYNGLVVVAHRLLAEVRRLQPFEAAVRKFCNDEGSGYDTLASTDVDDMRALCEYPKRDVMGKVATARHDHGG